MVLYSTHGPTILVRAASQIFAPWEAGPLQFVLSGVHVGTAVTNYSLSALILVCSGRTPSRYWHCGHCRRG